MEIGVKDNSVNLYGLHPMMQIANMKAAVIWHGYGLDLVITSGNDSKHMPGSLHYHGRACDYRIWGMSDEIVHDVVNLLKQKLGPDYDVVLEKDHIHCEYDPSNPKVI